MLLLPLLAPAQPTVPDLRSPAAYLPADQARFRAAAPAHPAAGPHRLQPGVAVLGWVPAWMPASHLRQVDFTLLSHVAYDGYQATEAGTLQAPPTGDAAPLAALVHQANPRCRVLLGVSYREPADGAALFEAAGQPARQALAQAVARQAGALGADGLYLDLAFRARPAVAEATARAGSKSELASTRKRLDKTLDDLNHRTRLLRQSGEGLQHVRDNFAKRRKQGKPVSASELSQYGRAQQQHQADSAQFLKERTRFRAERAALKQKQVLPETGPGGGDDARPAAVRELLAALRQALPQATLALGLPAPDSGRVYAGLLPAGALADLYVLQALDCTAGQAGEPGPLASWQPVAAAVAYYRQQGVPAAQLLLGLASVGKVWTRYSPAGEMPAEEAPTRYWYATSRSLAGWPPRSAQPDSVAGSGRLTLPPPPDSLQTGLLNAPYLAWVDDTASLGARLAWVRRQGLGGVGIWALGFDAPGAPLWRSLLTYLAVDAAPPAPAADTTAQLASTTHSPPDTTPAGDDSLLPPALAASGPLANGRQLLAVVLLALAVLLAGTWAGLAVGAGRTARYWVPFGRRRSWMLAGLLAGAALLGGYVSYLGVFSREVLAGGWLGALALLLLGWLAYRQARPATPLP